MREGNGTGPGFVGNGHARGGRSCVLLAEPPRKLRATVTLELRRGLAAAEVDRRVAELEHLGDVRARGLAFYLVDLADRGAHQELGFHSIVQYAQVRYGIRPATAREYLAVGRALEELPLIDEAFCAGTLLWSQVRLLVKVATAETESAWIDWARDRTVRELAAQARRREKGQRPTDPARRRIYTPRYKPQGDLNAAQMQMWNNARARLEAERGEPVSDTDLMMHAARLILASPPDTSVPGREPVNESHFKVVVYDREATLVFEPGTPVARPEPPQTADGATDAARAARATDAARAAPARRRGPAGSRPASLGRLVGQRRVVRNLRVVVRAARKRGEPVPHLLLEGPPGLGKTTIGRAVAADAGGGFRQVAAPVLREPGVLLRLLVGLGDHDVLFVDELHRLPPPVAELLYEAMEDRRLSLPVRCGNHQRTLHVQLAPFMLIGATTEPDRLPRPLVGRFGVREHVEFYSVDELAVLIHRRAAGAGLSVSREAAEQLARASRDTPREALALLRCTGDEAVLAGRPVIDAAVAARTLRRLGIDPDGLRPAERAYLRVLARAGRPLGCSTLAARLDVSPRTLRRVYEPYLVRRGLVRLTPRGRAPGR